MALAGLHYGFSVLLTGEWKWVEGNYRHGMRWKDLTN